MEQKGMSMKIECFTVGNFSVNTYLITDEATGKSAIIDTGETNQLVRNIQSKQPAVNVVMILLTHSHLDHAGALPLLQEVWDVPTYLPKKDRPLFDTLPMQGSMFGMPHLNRSCGKITQEIDDGFEIMLGNTRLKFLSTPGHTPGQGCWYNADDMTDIIVGDTLFAGSIGRTDFPMSNRGEMKESLRRLLNLPGEMRVHSGHGPVTTLGRELATNPFLGYLRQERGMPIGRSLSW